MPAVDIVMPCYNCGPWIQETIASIVAQDFTDWRILARDNCSTDDTRSHLAQAKADLSGRFVILDDSGTNNVGAIGNFNKLLAASSARWVMLADADDVWLPGKIKTSLNAIQALERSLPLATPILIGTDATVVDTNLDVLSPSYYRWTWGDPNRQKRLSNLLMQFSPPSSTLTLNRPLLSKSLPIPPGFRAMHESWFAAVATLFGVVENLSSATVLYRRHSSNTSPTPFPISHLSALRRIALSPHAARARVNEVINDASQLATAIMERFADTLSIRDKAVVAAAASLASQPALARRVSMAKHGLWFSSTLKNCAALLLM